MTPEDDRRLIDLLSRMVKRSRELQEEGHLRDRISRTEVDLLEHLLRLSRARLARRIVSQMGCLDERAEALVNLAREVCRTSEAIRDATLATRQRARQARKRLYRTRLIGRSA